jgi:hypothetical protein
MERILPRPLTQHGNTWDDSNDHRSVSPCRQVIPGEEVEPSTFVMPLWAFDQFVVSEVGEEPEITGDLSNVGMRRSDGLKAEL